MNWKRLKCSAGSDNLGHSLRTMGKIKDVYETSEEKLGFVLRKHEDWFDENNEEHVDLKN